MSKEFRELSSKRFLEKYNDLIAHKQFISACAKYYIMKHYVKVKDWTKLSIEVRGMDGANVAFYTHEPMHEKYDLSKIMDQIWKSIDDDSFANNNPVTSMSEFFLDPTDGDFGVFINGTEFYGLQDDKVIILADYIEKQIQEENLAF